MSKKLFLIVFFVFVVFSPHIFAQQVTFDAYIGVSKLIGEDSDYWNTGFHLGGGAFYQLNKYLWIGATIEYHRFTLNENELGSGVDLISSLGSAFVITPKIRAFLPGKSENLKFYGQIGAGLYSYNLKAEWETTAHYWGGYQVIRYKYDDSESRFGLNIALGMIIRIAKNISLEIIPIYHLIFEDQDCLGLSVGVNIPLSK